VIGLAKEISQLNSKTAKWIALDVIKKLRQKKFKENIDF